MTPWCTSAGARVVFASLWRMGMCLFCVAIKISVILSNWSSQYIHTHWIDWWHKLAMHHHLETVQGQEVDYLYLHTGDPSPCRCLQWQASAYWMPCFAFQCDGQCDGYFWVRKSQTCELNQRRRVHVFQNSSLRPSSSPPLWLMSNGIELSSTSSKMIQSSESSSLGNSLISWKAICSTGVISVGEIWYHSVWYLNNTKTYWGSGHVAWLQLQPGVHALPQYLVVHCEGVPDGYWGHSCYSQHCEPDGS